MSAHRAFAVAGVAFLWTGGAGASVPGSAVCYAPGACWVPGQADKYLTTFGSILSGGTCAAAAPGVNTNPLNAYIIWYNNGSHPWTLAQQQALVSLFTNISGSTWWTGITQSYPNSQDKGVSNPVTMSLTNCLSGLPAHCVTNPENEGTSQGTIIGSTADNEVTAGNLPNDANGVYIVAPSWNDITTTACQFSLNGRMQPVHNYAMTITAVRGLPTSCFSGGAVNLFEGSLTPNIDTGFDYLAWGLTGELATGIAEWCNSQSKGWQPFDVSLGTLTDMHDPCNSSRTGFFSSPNGRASNFTSQVGPPRYDWWLHDTVKAYAGGLCDSQPAPAFWSQGCAVNGDCPPYSNHCSSTLPNGPTGIAAHCLPPSCTDGLQNGFETAIDTGGGCSFPNAGPCNSDMDCQFVGGDGHGCYSGSCGSCTLDSQCPTDLPFCSGGTCEQCGGTHHCPGISLCLPGCIDCNTNADCPTWAHVCNGPPGSTVCVDCLSDADCSTCNFDGCCNTVNHRCYP